MHERGPLFESWMAHIRSGRKDVSWSSGAIDVEAKDGNSALLTDRCLRMLDQAENTGKPFFLHMCYDDPHPPYFVPRPYDTMFDPDELTLPETGDLQNLPSWHAIARDQAGIDKATDSDKRKALAIYYGMIRYIDDEMARIHAALEEKGLLENTWIILGSDHGDYTGEKGFFNKSESHYKCLLHVPLIIVPPKDSDEPNPRRIDDLVSCVDIFPTILKMAGVEAPTNQGRDILEWVRKGHTEPLRDVVFAQIGDYHGYIKTSWPSGMPEAGRHKSLTHSIRTSTRVYIQDPDNGDEAYDLRDDPNELHNLTNDITDPFPDLRQQLEQFTIECAALREKLDVVPGDRGFVEGWE